MDTRTLACIALVTCACILQGCTTPRQPFPATEMIASSEIPPPDPALDSYIALVPVEIAQTATVARAMAHISLGRARDRTVEELCAEGERLIPGEIADVTGPYPAADPDMPDGGPVWYYRISQQPGLGGCPEVQETRLFETMQSNLPAWIRIERAVAPYPALGLLE